MGNLPLTAIIVTYNSRQEIDTCLQSLFGNLNFDIPSNQEADVIVIDNASTDGTPEYLVRQWPQVKLLAQVDNLGFAAANNIGFNISQGDPVLLLNPDTVLTPGALSELLHTLELHPEAGLVGPRLMNSDGSLQSSCRDFPTLLGDMVGMFELYRLKIIRRLLGRYLASLSDHCCPRPVDWISGACLLVRRAAIDAVGLMDESFFMYSEEMEWQYRMAKKGWLVWFEPAAQVIHTGGASTARVPAQRIIWQYQSIFRFYRQYRNRVQRLALRLIVWLATWPKVILLAFISQNDAHRRQLLKGFWQVLWLH